MNPEYLIGKTITAARILGCPSNMWNKRCDSMNVLELSFSDDTTAQIVGGYKGYSGNSCDEYVETIEITA